jgi:hypothetical protein
LPSAVASTEYPRSDRIGLGFVASLDMPVSL